MGLRDDIIVLLREENYPINEVVTDALSEFLGVLEDEVENIDRDMIDDDEEPVDPEVD